MKTNKKVQKNSVQKSEKENAVKVTALAVIPKPIMLLTPQDVPTATEVTAPLETATVPTVTEETPQQVTFKTPLATATAETDLDITTVQPSTDNHRKTFNDASLQELAESIREVGVLQAIAVRPHTGGGYEIIYGERRYRASLLAGAKTIKATIYNNVTDDEAEDMSLSENLQREQVRPTEEAKAFKRLLEKGRYDMYSLVSRFGRSEKYIYTRLKLNELYAPIGELLDNETTTSSQTTRTIGAVTRSICSRNILRNTTQPTLSNTNSTRRNARHAYTTQPITISLPSITDADTAQTANVWKPRMPPMWQKRRRNF